MSAPAQSQLPTRLERPGSFPGLLVSRWLVIVLLCLLLAVCFLAVLVPQPPSTASGRWLTEHPSWAAVVAWAKLDHIVTSPLFLLLVVVTALSATVSVFRRIRQAWLLSSEGGLWRRVLARRKLFGSLIFHGGLVGIIVAALVSSLTRSAGTVCLTEGQALVLETRQLTNSSAPRILAAMARPFELRLDKFHAVHEGQWGTPDYASELTVIENGRALKQTTVSVNHPLSHRGVTVYQSRHGFSPQIYLMDEKGQLRFGSWVALQSDVESNPVRYYDEFMIPGTSLFVRAELFPDAYMEGDRLRNRSPDPGNCLLDVAVSRGSNTVYKGAIPMGQSVELESGLRFGFLGVRRWAGLELVQDRGANALFISGWIALAGICLRFAPNLGTIARRLVSTRRASS